MSGTQQVLTVLAPLTTLLDPTDMESLTSTCRVLRAMRNEDLHWQEQQDDHGTYFVNAMTNKTLRGKPGSMTHSDFIRLSSAKLLQTSISMMHYLASSPAHSQPTTSSEKDARIAELEAQVAALTVTVGRQQQELQLMKASESKTSRGEGNPSSKLVAENRVLREHIAAMERENTELREQQNVSQRRLRTVHGIAVIKKGYEGRLASADTIGSKARLGRVYDHSKSKMPAGWNMSGNTPKPTRSPRRMLKFTTRSKTSGRSSPTGSTGSRSRSGSPKSLPLSSPKSQSPSPVTTRSASSSPKGANGKIVWGAVPIPTAKRKERPASAPLARLATTDRAADSGATKESKDSKDGKETKEPDPAAHGLPTKMRLTFKAAAKMVRASRRLVRTPAYIAKMTKRLHTEDLGNSFFNTLDPRYADKMEEHHKKFKPTKPMHKPMNFMYDAPVV